MARVLVQSDLGQKEQSYDDVMCGLRQDCLLSGGSGRIIRAGNRSSVTLIV